MMLKKFNKLIEGYNRYMNHVARTKVREALLQSNDRMLEDAGFSRKLLEQGVQAWPWRQTATEQREKPLAFDKLSELQTVSGLKLGHDERLQKQRVNSDKKFNVSLATETISRNLEENHKKVA